MARYSLGAVTAGPIHYSDISINVAIASSSDIDGVKIVMSALEAPVSSGETSYPTRIRLYTNPFIQDLGDILAYNLPQDGTIAGSMGLLGFGERSKVIPNETSRMGVAVVAAVEFYAGGKWQTAKTETLFDFGLPALRSYAVNYYPNGASASTVTATKYYNRAMTLGTGFSRPGWRFTGWNTAANGTGTAYAAGASYTGNAALALYAQWVALPAVTSIELRRVDASGDPDDMGQVIEARAECTKDASLSIASLTFSCGGITAAGSPGEWVELDVAARADTAYTVAAAVKDSAGYSASRSAVSSTAYENPSIASVSAYRVDPNGNLDDEGTCMAVEVDWRVAAVGSQQRPLSLTVACGGLTASAPPFEPAVSGASAAGSSLIAMGLVPVEPEAGDSPVLSGWWVKAGAGTEADPYRYERADDASPVEGARYYRGAYGTEEAHALTVTLSDAINAVIVEDVLTTAFYTMDVLGDSFAGQRPGHGIAFGKPCNREGFDVAMDQYSYGERQYPTFIRPTKPAEADLPTLPCMVYVEADKSLWLYTAGGGW